MISKLLSANKAKNRIKTWQFWLAAGLFLSMLLTALAFVRYTFTSCAQIPFVDWVLVLLASPAFVLIGLAIFWFHPTNRIAWLCLFSGAGLASSSFLYLYFDCYTASRITGFWSSILLWYFYNISSLLLLVPLFMLLPALFPTGQFFNPSWRKLTLILLLLLGLSTAALGISPNFNQDNGFGFSYPLDNPFGLSGLPDGWGAFWGRTRTVLAVGLSLSCIASFVLRFRRSQGEERQQIKWFAYFLATAVTLQLIVFESLALLLAPMFVNTQWEPLITAAYDGIITIVFVGFPLTIGIAVFKYRLYDIDIIIRRTLVYGALTVLLGAVYLSSVVVLQQVLGTFTGQQDSPLAIVISTLAIAALFSPLRNRLQAFIDKRFYRRRYDAERTLAEFAKQSRNETDLDSLTDMLAESVIVTMQPENLNLWLSGHE